MARASGEGSVGEPGPPELPDKSCRRQAHIVAALNVQCSTGQRLEYEKFYLPSHA